MRSSDAGCRYLCPCWLCVLQIRELEARGGTKQTDGGSMVVHRCGTLFLDLRRFVWMCLAVKFGTTLSLLTLPSVEKEGWFFFPHSLSLFVPHFTGKICVLVRRDLRREP